MAFVSVQKDLSKIKTKVAMNLTLRQIVSFSIGAVIGLPVYWYSRSAVGNDLAVYLMIACIAPFFFAAVFEKDGIVFEKYVGYVIKQRFLHPKVRLYKTENFYEYLDDIGREEAVIVRAKAKEARKRQARKKDTQKAERKKTGKGSIKATEYAAETL